MSQAALGEIYCVNTENACRALAKGGVVSSCVRLIELGESLPAPVLLSGV